MKKPLIKFKPLKKQNTLLSKEEQRLFEELKKDEKHTKTLSDDYDYDIKGAFKKIYKENKGDKVLIEKSITKESPEQHIFTDEFKKSNHPTFSNESIYSNFFRKGGEWSKTDIYSKETRKDSYKERIPEEGGELDTFYKNNKHVSGMYEGGKTVSRNKYSDLPKKNLDYVIDLEKYRGLMLEKGAPKTNFRLTKQQKKQFEYYADDTGASQKEKTGNKRDYSIKNDGRR